MAGHSKFKNIMYRKGAQDKKRSALFSKLSREITVAAKMECAEDGGRIWTSVESLNEVAKALEPLIGGADSAKRAWKPGTEVEVRGEGASGLMKRIDWLEDDDDVQTVWGNYDVPEEEL